MSMLSKLLKASEVEALPIPFRTDIPSLAPPVQSDKGPAPDGIDLANQLVELRTQCEELKVSAGRQSQQTFESGRQAGERSTREALEGEVRKKCELLGSALTNLVAFRAEVIQRAEADMVSLAVEIARRVLHRELTVDTRALEALATSALEKLQSQDIIRVRVHPDQEKVLKECTAQIGRTAKIGIVIDLAQPKGGIVFETSRGDLDASTDTQLNEIERGLSDRIEARQ